MNKRIRRGGIVAVVVASVAMAAGAASVRADSGAPDEPVSTEVPAEETPPSSNTDAVEGEVVPTAPLPTDTTAPSTLPPPSPEPASAEAAPTTTLPQASSEPVVAQVAPTSTTTPMSRTSTTPQTATVTTTRQPEAAMSLLAATAPTAPRSPVAKPGNRSVKLTWLAPASNGGRAIDKYVVQRSRNKTSWTKIATTTGRRYTAKGLTNGTKYYFRVRAHNPAGFGPHSTVVSAVPRTRPSAPTSPVATPGHTSIKLTWKAPASNGGAAIDKYAVQRYTSTGWKTIAYPPGSSHTTTGLTNGTKYSFRVLAHNAAGWGPYSTVVGAVPRTVPSHPNLQTATPANGQVTLAWTAPASNGGAPIDKYAVQRATSLTGPWTNVGYPTTLGFTANGLTNGTKYFFRIRAHNAAGWSPASAVHAATPRTVPGAPQSLTATPYYTEIDLRFLAPSSDGGAPIDSYRIMMKTGVLGPWTLYADTSSTSPSIHFLQPGVAYQFMVLAHNGVGWGPASSPVTVVAGAVSAPKTCSAVQLDVTNWIHVDWTTPDGWAAITYYRVDLHDVTTSPAQKLTTVITAGADTEVDLLVPNVARTYRATIRAITAVGTSDACFAEVYIPPT